MWFEKRRLCVVSQLDGGIMIKYTIGIKCIGRLLAVGKSCGISIVDYVRKSRKQ